MMRRVPRRKVSPYDPRPPASLRKGGMIGGDRMTDHGYADAYAEALTAIGITVTADWLRKTERRFATGLGERPGNRKAIAGTLVEMGVLQGIGLAVWCDLLTVGSVIGLDVDTSHWLEFKWTLVDRGAFAGTVPTVAEFDELAPTAADDLAAILAGRKIDVFIDDALHDSASIMQAMGKVLPLMADRFVYFVEDNAEVHAAIKRAYPHLRVAAHGQLTIVSR